VFIHTSCGKGSHRMAKRGFEIQIETRLSHELFIYNQIVNAPARLNIRTGVARKINS
jgi:hypothetical protein